MPERHIDIVMPALNEARGMTRSLDSVAQEIQYVGNDTSVHLQVVANGCSDTTAAVAKQWGQNRTVMPHGFDFSVLELERGNKNHAINEGIKHSEHDLMFVIDSDVTLDRFALASLETVLRADRPLAASLYHAADPAYLPTGPLGDIVRMADLRRQSIPVRHKLHGGFMGWNSHASVFGKLPIFPEKVPVSDDTWLSYALIAEHGLSTVHSVNSGIYSRYIPPQTESDFIDQHSRYAVADEMVTQAYPLLAGAVALAHAQIPKPKVVETDWRRLCAEHEVDFDANIAHYAKMRAEIAQNTEVMKQTLLTRNGTWPAVSTARL